MAFLLLRQPEARHALAVWFAGPRSAIALMALTQDAFRLAFWAAAVPAGLMVADIVLS